jgi:hypothetical protein
MAGNDNIRNLYSSRGHRLEKAVSIALRHNFHSQQIVGKNDTCNAAVIYMCTGIYFSYSLEILPVVFLDVKFGSVALRKECRLREFGVVDLDTLHQ